MALQRLRAALPLAARLNQFETPAAIHLIRSFADDAQISANAKSAEMAASSSSSGGPNRRPDASGKPSGQDRQNSKGQGSRVGRGAQDRGPRLSRRGSPPGAAAATTGDQPPRDRQRSLPTGRMANLLAKEVPEDAEEGANATAAARGAWKPRSSGESPADELENGYTLTWGEGTEEVVEMDSTAVEDWDAARVGDPSKLPFLKYHATQEELRRLGSGYMNPAEQEELVERLEMAMMSSETDDAMATERALQLQMDPHYQIGESMLVTPTADEPKARQPSSAKVLDAHKEELMAMFGLSEEEYQEMKAEAVAELGSEYGQKLAKIKAPNYRKQEKALDAMLERSVPADHPNYSVIQQKLAVLQANPWWPHERKVVFAKRLIKDLA